MCDDSNKVVICSSCGKECDPDSIEQDEICASCQELDTTPTTEECDQCDGTAVKNICGQNLCDDCLEHYHY